MERSYSLNEFARQNAIGLTTVRGEIKAGRLAAQAAIRAELLADDSCSALGMTVRGPAPVLALCRLLVEAGHDPATPLEAWRGDVPCLRIRSIGAAAALRIGTHGVGFETLSECTAASPMRQNEVASAHSPSRAAP
jgi:hypothetical protein